MFTYIYIYNNIYKYAYIYISISNIIYIYIYIYLHVHIGDHEGSILIVWMPNLEAFCGSRGKNSLRFKFKVP